METKQNSIQDYLLYFKNSLLDVSRNSKLLFHSEHKSFLPLKTIFQTEYNCNTFSEQIKQETLSIQIETSSLQKNTAAVLNKLRLKSLASKKNKGISNLKISLGYIHWLNTTNQPITSECSPLFFVSAKLTKDKKEGVVLSIENTIATVNPSLQYFFKDSFDIHLPSEIDLKQHSLPSIIKLLNDLNQKSKSTIEFEIGTTESFSPAVPLKWFLDPNEIKLGNFDYPKLSLVTDYENLLTKPLSSPIISRVLKDDYVDNVALPHQAFKIEDYYNISPLDPSQEQALIQARNGTSFILQGPPGTGKSQTISNVIADFIARDKKVLFLSEKRTALDTVFHKLQESNLDNITSLIHNVYTDKSKFNEGLTKAYKAQQETALNFESIQHLRQTKIANLQTSLQKFTRHQNHMLEVPDGCTSVNHLQLLKIAQGSIPTLTTTAKQQADYAIWEAHGDDYSQLYKTLTASNFNAAFNQHPLYFLNASTYHTADTNSIQTTISNSINLVQNYLKHHEKLNVKTTHFLTIEDGIKATHNFELIQPYLLTETFELFNVTSRSHKEFHVDLTTLNKLKIKFENACNNTKDWKTKIPQIELNKYRAIITEFKHKTFPILYKKYRKLKQNISANHTEKKWNKSTISIVLNQLEEYYEAATAYSKTKAILSKKYHTDNLEEIQNAVTVWTKHNTHKNHSTLAALKEQKAPIESLEKISQLKNDIASLSTHYNIDVSNSLTHLFSQLKATQNNLSLFHKIQSSVASIYKTKLATEIFFNVSTPPKLLEKELAQNTLKKGAKLKTSYTKHTLNNWDDLIENFNKNYKEFLVINSHYIQAKQSQSFTSKIRQSVLSNSGLNLEQKKAKEQIVVGRKIIESESKKQQKFLSIKELHESAAREIILDLKPVWLMSPLSVSDIFPLEENLFDLVIFDESSQVKMEGALPTIYRAKQCIVVGDKMQLPPSNFFQKKLSETTSNTQHESILHFTENKLPSLPLLWHYRSKDDRLINFNNHAFYKQELKTIPNQTNHYPQSETTIIRSANQAAFTYEDIRTKPLSFHYLPNGIFEERKNNQEAKYIAELIKHFLLSKQELSLGVIALSNEQENAIKKQLKKISYFEKDYDQLLQDKINSQEFYESIFVKNLENIQGEERDIIIISIGYAHDANHSLSLNFGPINHEGGDRRLNVLFSRARKHLCLVSSILEQDIKTTTSKGAQILKEYLHFAYETSCGKSTFISGLFNDTYTSTNVLNTNPIRTELKALLEERSYYVEEQYGNSTFRINLAVKKKKGKGKFALAILIDDEQDFYTQSTPFSFAIRQNILNEFSWKTYLVLTQNWIEDKEEIVADICLKLEEESLLKKEKKKAAKASLSSLNYELSISDLLFTRLENKEENPKFWQIAGKLNDLVIQYGKIGKKGKTLIKNYTSVAEVIEQKRKLIKQKEQKGYKRV